jgi:hypothetical protein
MNFTDFLKANKPEWFNLDRGHELITRAIDTAATCKQDALILAPPRCGKSTIFADLLPRWLTEVCKVENVIVACGSPDIAGHWRKHFDAIASEGAQRSVYFVAAGAPLCGRGADVFILNPYTLDNPNLAEWYTSTVRTRLMPSGYVLAVDSRSGNGDFASHLMRQGMATTHVLPDMLRKTYDDGRFFDGVLSSTDRMSIWNQFIGADDDTHPAPPADDDDWSNLSKALEPFLPQGRKKSLQYAPLDDISQLRLVSFKSSSVTGKFTMSLEFESPFLPPHPLS